MKFSKLALYFSKLEETASRLTMTEILADLLKEANEREIDKVVYLILGELGPSYTGIVFNLAEKMMIQVVSQAFGEEIAKVKKLYKEMGDLGNVSEELCKKRGGVGKKDLEITDLYNKLLEIAEDEGEGSQERKIENCALVLEKLQPLGARYFPRIPVGKLRLGFSDKTILDALSWMERKDKSAKKTLDNAYNVLPDVGQLAKRVKKLGIDEATKNIIPELGVPVLPMLAQRLKSPKEMIKKMGEVAVEPKLDGLRIILHFKRGKNGLVKAFTRNLNETSWMFPELEGIGEDILADEVILDTEAIGVDEKRKAFANFQTTMTRRRKHDISQMASKIPIVFFAFDILYKDGENYIGEEYRRRREILENLISKDSKVLRMVDVCYTKSADEISRLNKEKQSEGLEGIIIKRANSKYISGRTGWRWVKMKEAEDSVAKLVDTVDCLVMGYTVGKGKRAKFGVGQFLAGVKDGAKFKTITKVGTGLTDEQFIELKQKLSKLEVLKKPKEYMVDKELTPDYWVKPNLMVELAADEITKSPKHTSKYALRFPRLIKFRDDKDFEQATTLKEIVQLFKIQ